MKTVSNYRFHRRASAAFNELTNDEQAEVRQVLTDLPRGPSGPWPGDTKRLPGDLPLFMLRANDSLRVIVLAVDGQPPQVMDIVRRETIESFAKAEARNGQ
jgi:hypothetical protein